MTTSAELNWDFRENDFPQNGSAGEKLGFALKLALLASSELARQTWHFRVGAEHVELFAHDPEKPEASDPDDREAFIHCGAGLSYLKLALKHFGSLGRVELFPDLDQPALVARVLAGCGRERDAQERALFAAMTRDHLHFAPLDECPASAATLDLLRYAAMGERAWLEFAQSEFSRQRLFSLATAQSPPAGAGRPTRRDVSIPTGARSPATRSVSTVNRQPAGTESIWTGPFLALSVRTSNSSQLTVQSEEESSGQWTALAVIKSRTDDKHGWVAAGQATARVLLYAGMSGLSWSFLNRALHSRAAREELLTGMGRKGFPQVVIRFGSKTPLTTLQPTTSRSVTAIAHA
jgi:hypothetical protein